MKGILKFAFAVCLGVVAGSASIKAQTVVLDGLGSSGLFLELGLAANSSAGALKASCVWSEVNNTVVANDTSVGATTLQDKGSAWVAWTTGTGTGASCTSPAANAQVYAYLSTDSVVGNRCLYNSNLSTSKCSISYAAAPSGPANKILHGGIANCGTIGECALPAAIVAALDATTVVNFAGTDIRPEDAEFAISRALANCGSVVGTSTQYLGLGYPNGSSINTAVTGSTNSVNVINFALPSTGFFLTPVGVTPIIIAVNDVSGMGLRSFSNISSQALAGFLDGTNSFTNQASASPTATGSPVTVFISEPLSGEFNVMEYNVPNRTGTLGGSFATSQDVGLNQPANQRNCTVTSPWPVPSSTPSAVLKQSLDFATTSGGSRLRAIGTSQELSSVSGATTGNVLGYGFWNAANFAGFAFTATARYYDVDGIDPLNASGTIPTSPAELANINLSSTADGKYPIWSMLRLVNVGTTQNANVAALSAAAQAFAVGAHPDFVAANNLLVVRSHFAPPGQTLTPSNGSGRTAEFGLNAATACSATETGGDVGGVIIGLKTNALSQSPLTLSESNFCKVATPSTLAGQTGHRQ